MGAAETFVATSSWAQGCLPGQAGKKPPHRVRQAPAPDDVAALVNYIPGVEATLIGRGYLKDLLQSDAH